MDKNMLNVESSRLPKNDFSAYKTKGTAPKETMEQTFDFSSNELLKSDSFKPKDDLTTLTQRSDELAILLNAQKQVDSEIKLPNPIGHVDPQEQERINKEVSPKLCEVKESEEITQENFKEFNDMLKLGDSFYEAYGENYKIEFVTLEDGRQTVRMTDKESGKIVADYDYGTSAPDYNQGRVLVTYSYDDRGTCRVDRYEQGYAMEDGKFIGWAEQLNVKRPFYFDKDGNRVSIPENWKNDFEQNPIHRWYWDDFN